MGHACHSASMSAGMGLLSLMNPCVRPAATTHASANQQKHCRMAGRHAVACSMGRTSAFSSFRARHVCSATPAAAAVSVGCRCCSCSARTWIFSRLLVRLLAFAGMFAAAACRHCELHAVLAGGDQGCCTCKPAHCSMNERCANSKIKHAALSSCCWAEGTGMWTQAEPGRRTPCSLSWRCCGSNQCGQAKLATAAYEPNFSKRSLTEAG